MINDEVKTIKPFCYAKKKYVMFYVFHHLMFDIDSFNLGQ